MEILPEHNLEPPDVPEWECIICGAVFYTNDPTQYGEFADNVTVHNGRALRMPGGHMIECWHCLEQMEGGEDVD